jgi:hypothetical protein
MQMTGAGPRTKGRAIANPACWLQHRFGGEATGKRATEMS